MNDINFIEESFLEADKELFFGPLREDDKFICFPEGWDMACILAAAGIFPSVTQARKNGWNKPIPPGFSRWQCGKNRTNIFILNRFFIEEI